MSIVFRGYHGTPASRLELVRTLGIKPSVNPDDWLGGGTYFFIEGLADPWTSAFEWARCKAWDKAENRFREKDIAVIEFEISVEPGGLFDLRDPDNAREFHHARRRWLKERVPRRATHRARPSDTTYDTDLLDQFKRDHGIAVLIGEFHIQFSVRERHFRIDSRIPNVSMLCLSPPASTSVQALITAVDVVPQASILETSAD